VTTDEKLNLTLHGLSAARTHFVEVASSLAPLTTIDSHAIDISKHCEKAITIIDAILAVAKEAGA